MQNHLFQGVRRPDDETDRVVHRYISELKRSDLLLGGDAWNCFHPNCRDILIIFYPSKLQKFSQEAFLIAHIVSHRAGLG